MFVDEARVHTSGGRGGDGAATFNREKYRGKGGPDGGSGGRGGSVLFQADPGTGSLAWVGDHPHQRADSGSKGARNKRTGADGDDLIVRVPVGTVVHDEQGQIMADLGRSGDRFLAARGGRGGKGNAALMTRNRRAPGFAELGEPGEERWLNLELRLIADVAVIGYPNAGKSTLVAAVSAARPKVADYPFTTLDPSLGVVELGRQGGSGEGRFTICDIPGLIEGAHEGKGLGIKFLRHAERAMVFLHLVDLVSGRDPVDDYEKVRSELSNFESALASRPEVIALNKADVTDQAEAVRDKFLRLTGIHGVHVISAVRGDGLDTLMEELHELVKSERGARAAESFRLYRTETETITVKRELQAWRVAGKRVEKWVAMTDLSNPEAVAYLQDRMDSAGVEKMLERAGARPGQEVRIGKASFEWWPKEPPQAGETEPQAGEE